MSIPIDMLTENDYLILAYIKQFESVSEAQIIKHFKDKPENIKHRLHILSKIEYRPSGNTFCPIPNSSYIIEEFTESSDPYSSPSQSKHSFHISPLGSVALQDYNSAKKSAKKDTLFKNVYIPIVVTLITNLIIDVIKLLLPLILQWLSNNS